MLTKNCPKMNVQCREMNEFIPFPVDKSLHILYEFEFLKYQ